MPALTLIPLARRSFLACCAAASLPVLPSGCAEPSRNRMAATDPWRRARFVLLGEVHDNAEQHRLRAALLRDLLADGRPTGVVFEQLARSADAAIAAAARDADTVADAGRLDRRAWGWPLHRPLIEAALAGGAAVRGGNLDPAEVRAIVRGGADALPADLRALLAAPGWQSGQQRALEAEIDAGHCHALPPAQWPAMALAQRARDAAMAQALLQAAGTGGGRAVLVAGNGHVRRDLGVPHVLRAAGVPAAQIVAIGYVEADDAAAPYDVVQVTAPVERADPCAAFAK